MPLFHMTQPTNQETHISQDTHTSIKIVSQFHIHIPKYHTTDAMHISSNQLIQSQVSNFHTPIPTVLITYPNLHACFPEEIHLV
jgi:hypothetical protein